jgi:hypothetical protein
MDFAGAEKFSGFAVSTHVMSEVTQPDPWLSSRFEPDFLVPVQFYDLTRRRGSLDGETRLVFAVLEDAVRCYVKNVHSTRRSDREQFEEVSAWFESREAARTPFSFESVCDVLGIEPSTLRKQLKTLSPNDLPTKQLRSVGRRQVVRAGRSARKRARRGAMVFQGIGKARMG